MNCKFCNRSKHSHYPPKFVLYDLDSKEIMFAICAQCASNIEKALRQLEMKEIYGDEDIPF